MEAKKTAAVVTNILRLLADLDSDECRRALQTVATFHEISLAPRDSRASLPRLDSIDLDQASSVPFSGREDIGPKEFLLQKNPLGNSQRVACLAFYLAHYRNSPFFKTADLTALNTEAAQARVANMADAAYNASRSGYLVTASKGKRQLSAYGEQFVLALPDQESAALVMSNGRNSSARTRPPKATKKSRNRVDELLGKSSK